MSMNPQEGQIKMKDSIEDNNSRLDQQQQQKETQTIVRDDVVDENGETTATNDVATVAGTANVPSGGVFSGCGRLIAATAAGDSKKRSISDAAQPKSKKKMRGRSILVFPPNSKLYTRSPYDDFSSEGELDSVYDDSGSEPDSYDDDSGSESDGNHDGKSDEMDWNVRIDEADYCAVKETIARCREIKDESTLDDQDVLSKLQIRYHDRRVNQLVLSISRPELLRTKLLPSSVLRLDVLVELNLAESEIVELPSWIGSLKNLEVLDLSGTHYLSSLPTAIGRMTNLRKLNLSYSNISSLPGTIGRLKNLSKLNLSSCNKLRSLPYGLGRATNLQVLDVSDSSISSFPASIKNLKKLKSLSFYYTPEYFVYTLKRRTHTEVKSLPAEIGGATNLQVLNLYQCSIVSLPASIGNLKNLRELNISYTCIRNLPQEIGGATNLQELDLYYLPISSLPSSIGNLKKLRKLVLGRTTSLKTLPDEIGQLTALEYLCLSLSGISCIPSTIGNLKNLKDLRLERVDGLKNLPDEIGDVTNLQQINLEYSSIVSLPASLHNLKNLRSLNLHDSLILKAPKPNPILLSLANQCPMLGCVGCRNKDFYSGNIINEEYEHLMHKLSLNRLRYRTINLYDNKENNNNNNIPPGLWPLVLQKAKSALDGRLCCCSSCSSSLSQSDAIYHMLVERCAGEVACFIEGGGNIIR